MNKKVTIWVCSILLVLLLAIGIGLLVAAEHREVPSIRFMGNVTVEDGVPNPAKEYTEFVVEKDGKYCWSYQWKGEPGIITGMSIFSPEGEAVFSCTADWCYAQSVEMELKKGTYDVEITYITNTEAFRLFLEEHGMNEAGADDYEYAANGTWNTEYKIALEQYMLDYVLKISFIFGAAIGLTVVGIVLAITKNGNKTKCEYDERQELVRGRGFKYGFFSMLIGNGIFIMLKVLGVTLFDNIEAAMMISIIIGVCIFASYCIWNDGYFALNENRRKLYIVLGVIGGINIIVSIGNIVHGSILEEGRLTLQSGNLFVAIVFIVIFIVLLLKQIKDGKED
ncbi:MAG: hypothetical protein E7288_10780 [Lachnospiraceae bacterium]|nr:hypothetical protein [Lachnospiraceae bacterium]